MNGLTSYQELTRRLYPRLSGGIRWGIERTERLLEAAGNPHRRYPTVHIAGTNGKGSVAAILASVLRRAGVRVGVYTSPHLCTFRERVQVDGRPVSEEAMLAAGRRLWPAVQREEPSFFEATTAIAFQALADADIELGIIEVGLGGRLDATNVVHPELAIITNIALDHSEFLGATLDEVADEKAGVMKPSVPVLTAERTPGIRARLRGRAEEVGAPFHAVDGDALSDVRISGDGMRFRLRSGGWGELGLETPLVGWHQARNAALAVRALELMPSAERVDAAAVADGLAGVVWPGRMQIEAVGGQRWVFDVAHNPAGARALRATLASLSPPRPLVVLGAVLRDKDWRGMLSPLLPIADAAVLTLPPSMPEHRRWDPVTARAALGAPDAVEAQPEFGAALERARLLAGPGASGGTVVVTGSFHTVGDALKALDRAPFGADAPLPACTTPA